MVVSTNQPIQRFSLVLSEELITLCSSLTNTIYISLEIINTLTNLKLTPNWNPHCKKRTKFTLFQIYLPWTCTRSSTWSDWGGYQCYDQQSCWGSCLVDQWGWSGQDSNLPRECGHQRNCLSSGCKGLHSGYWGKSSGQY